MVATFSISTPFAVVGLLPAAFGVWLIFLAVQRGITSRLSWVHLPGCITNFKYYYGQIGANFEYRVDGTVYHGNKFFTGIDARPRPDSVNSFPKSTYLLSDGSLKIPPGAPVEVYYDPKNPADSALIPGIPPFSAMLGPLIFVALGLLIAAAGLGTNRWMVIAPSMFLCAGLVMCLVALKGALRYLRTRRFPFTAGHLLSAKVGWDTGAHSPNSEFLPVVDFEYEVNGVRYRSTQLSAINGRIVRRRESAERLVEALRAKPEVQVFYDVRAPWDAFLQQGPVWGGIGMIALGVVFSGIGIAMMLTFHLSAVGS